MARSDWQKPWVVIALILGIVLAALAGSMWAKCSVDRGDAGGGDRRPAPSPAPPPPPPPSTEPPEARLAHAREAWEKRDLGETARWLETLLHDAGEPGRVAATWLVTIRIQRHDPEGAAKAVERVKAAFEGRGRTHEGRSVGADLLAESVVDAGIDAARARVEGPAPDVAGAKRASEIARAWATEGQSRAVDVAETYVGLSDVSLDHGYSIGTLRGAGHARVIAFADDFQLGEPVLVGVLKRWARGLPVLLFGRLTDHVREGNRRVKVDSAKAEIAALDRRAERAGLKIEGIVGMGASGRAASPGDPDVTLASHLGLGEGAVVFVLDAEGRLVGRMSGRALDPRPLDPVVARLVPDPSVIAPPK